MSPGTAATGRFGWGGVAIVAAVSLTVGGAVGTGVGALGAVLLLGDETSAPQSAAADGPGTVGERLGAELPRLQAFVEDYKGATFDGVPQVRVLADDEFTAALTAPSTAVPVEPSLVDPGATAAALGLTGDRDDFDAAWYAGSVGATTGFYDPVDDVLYVRGTDWTPLVEITVVHELVHALQDQQVDLTALTRATRTDDESYLALSALVEGEASLVEGAYLDRMPDEFWDRLVEEEESAYEDLPWDPFAEAVGALPYELGWQAASDLYDHGGPASFAAALAQPPTTLEQVWDVVAWLDRDLDLTAAADLEHPPPPAGARVLERGVLGAHLLALLGLSGDDLYLPEDGPVDGWAGDRYTTWADGGGRTCTLVVVATDGGAAATALQQRLEDWVDGGGSVTPDGSTLRLERCSDA